MIRRALGLGSAAIVLLALIPSPAASYDGPAPNTGTVVTGLSDVYAMVAGRHHIYLTPGAGGSTIAVMNPDGSQHGTIDDVAGASGVAIVHGTLFVAASGSGEIARFDLSTEPPTQLPSFSTAPLASPRDLLYAGGHLWFTSGCDVSPSRVGRMPLDGSPVRELVDRSDGWNHCTGLDGNAFAPNRIFLHDQNVDAAPLFEFAVGEAKPRLVVVRRWSGQRYHGQTVAPLPTGDVFAMAWRRGSPSTFSMKDMTGPIDGYRGIAGALVPTEGNGGFLAGTRRIDGGVGQVKVWRLGSPEPSIKFDFNDDYRRPFGPLAFSPDGIDLYVVTGSPPSSVVVFRVLDPTVQPSHVFAELTDRTIKAGQTTQIDVHLDTPGTNRDVTLLAAPWQGLGGGAWQVVATRTVDADGNAEFTVTADRHTDYDVEYAGDADTARSGYGAMTVFVEASISGEMQGAFEVVNGVAHYHDADAVAYAMHVEPSDIQLFFHAHVEYNNNGAWTPLMTTDVTGTGDATATFDADVLGPGHYRVSASSSGSIVVYNGESGWTRFAIES